jgi:hypothetical protein
LWLDDAAHAVMLLPMQVCSRHLASLVAMPRMYIDDQATSVLPWHLISTLLVIYIIYCYICPAKKPV